jgi:UDP-glucose 4-epimerase
MPSSSSKKILITGGAGYIGSHTTQVLKDHGYQCIVYDNLSSGNRHSIEERQSAELVIGDLADHDKLDRLMAKEKFSAVIHFAASIIVSESSKNPLLYYKNNTANSLQLLELCLHHGIDNFVFSSTAATYGVPATGYASEDGPQNPINPYGHSKLMIEQFLKDFSRVSSLKYVGIRYFNVAGASLDNSIGQVGQVATHILKICSQAAVGLRKAVEIYGTDYPTPDGTCIRDYVHVVDLAHSHLKALQYLERGGDPVFVNCGSGKGHSVREVIATMLKISEKKFDVIEGPRRDGDPPILVAEAKKIGPVLGWTPTYPSLEFMAKTAYEWEKKYLNLKWN